MKYKLVIDKLLNQSHLSELEAESVMSDMIDGEYSPIQTAALLTALHMKKGHVDEIVGFIKALRRYMQIVPNSHHGIDTCGTGGDGRGTFNISTAVALVVAATGVPVAKHGNRNASSLCGSADVLEVLGMNINVSPQQAADILKKTNMVFLFAPLFHPALKSVMPVRRELGFRTVFNYLGPFLNPAQVKKQMIGVPSQKSAELLAQVAVRLQFDSVLIVTSEDGLDEISLSAPSHLYMIKKGFVEKTVMTPELLGYKRVTLADITGGDAQYNAEIIRKILAGEKGPKRDIVVINAAYALLVAGRVHSIKDGVVLASEAIDSGKSKSLLNTVTNLSQLV